ncbi:MAG TPA: DNA translocase FtsK [Opitutaceae bacterium]|nr:DNA translocase FtsK [Opitutaceae bacterium]
MPKSETSNPIDGPSYKAPRYRPNWFAAVICFVLAAYLTMALVTYDPSQSTFRSTEPSMRHPVGWIGADAVWVLLYTIGASTWLLPVFLFWMLIVAVRNARHLAAARITSIFLATVTLSGLWAMLENIKPSDYFPNGPGGWVGAFIYQDLMAKPFGPFGTALLLGTLYFFSLLFIFTKDIGTEIEKIFAGISAWRAERRAENEARKAARQKQKEEKAKQTAAVARAAQTAPPMPIGPSGKKLFVPKASEEPLSKGTQGTPTPIPSATAASPASGAASKAETKPSAPTRLSKPPMGAPATDTKPLQVAAGKVELNIVKPEETKKAKITLPQTKDENYQFPPLSLLKEQVQPAAGNSEEEHRQNAENLLRILGEFGVEVTLGEIHVGPVITRYEVVPAAGVRVEKIAGLDKNIALGMRAQSVRILAPIPGKAAVGVEVPNQHPTPVGMRELLEAEDWASAKAEIPIALGKDVSGIPLISDLAKMPHLLIAGATGSGKSVCINSIVASILYSKSPKDLRLIMVDPKVVELKIFNSLPHMLIPVVTEPKKVPAALKWLLAEMEQRYQIFAKANVRNIVGFNSRKKTPKADTPPPPETQGALEGVDPLAADDGIEIPERLPYIVAIIDELADLMMVAPAEIETSIARLAQLARAAGIHLIIATQRPSVNVITGVIKANLPSRIAFQVASQVDSRTILDVKGADTLIGRGDMLFSPPGTSRLVRAQGAFVSDEEVQALVEFLKVNGPPQYATSVQQQIDRAAREEEEGADGEGENGDLGDDEELYNQALDVLKSTKRASTSMLQRRLRIGYNRAARIMEIMEEKGIVGPENGSSPREILTDLDAL